MEEQPEWVHFSKIEWNDPKNNQFNIDTRDFHCGYNLTAKLKFSLSAVEKYKDRFFFSEAELKEVIERLFKEIGGEGEWRFLQLKHKDERVNNWNLKYLRIYRLPCGNFIICNNDYKALMKELLSCEVDLEFLHKH
jgi:hypothetical protein